MAHDRERENLQAGYVYIVRASFGTLALLLAFGLLAGADGAFSFAAIRDADHASALISLVVVLVLIGTGSKAGFVHEGQWPVKPARQAGGVGYRVSHSLRVGFP